MHCYISTITEDFPSQVSVYLRYPFQTDIYPTGVLTFCSYGLTFVRVEEAHLTPVTEVQ